MGDPFASIVPFCEASSSQDLPLFPPSAGEGSQESESSGRLRVEPTGIFLVSPPESPEVAVPAASSGEKWVGCVGAGPAGGGKTVDLERDTDLGFSETEMAQQRVAELESGGTIGGCRLVQVELPESELTEFMNWKRKLAFRARLLDERPAKQLVLEKSSSFDPHGARAVAGAGIGIVEEKSRDKMVKSMKDLKSCSVVPRLGSPEGLQMKDQMLIESNECTRVVSLNSEAVMVKNGLELNDGSEAVRLFSGGKGAISEAVRANNGLGSNDSTEDAEMAKTGLDLKDCAEVVGLGSGEKGLVSDQGIAKTQVVMLDPEHNDLVSDEDTAKLGLARDDSTEEIAMDSDDEGLVTDEAITKHGLESIVPTEAVEDGVLVSSAGPAKKRPALNYAAEEVDKAPNTGTTEMSMHKGEGMGSLKNVEDIDAPSGSNSSQRLKPARALPITMQAKEGDSSKNPSMDLLSSALRKLPKTHFNPMFENLSILEIAKHRGVTFPRPRWW